MGSKTAIITSGGGMGCSYAVGAIFALIEKFGLENPDIVIGGSGSVGTLAYYVSKQYDSINNIWTELICSKKFYNPLRFWKMVDIDYVVDDIFKKQDPLDMEKVKSSNTEFLIPVTNYRTGQVEYFSNRDDVDIFEVMRASQSLPFLYPKVVDIKGERYCDGILSSSVGLNILKAVEMGADKLIIIDNEIPSEGMVQGFNFWSWFRSKEFRKNYLEGGKIMEGVEIPKGVEAVFLSPEEKLIISTMDNRRESLRYTINQGYEETYRNEDLKKLLR